MTWPDSRKKSQWWSAYNHTFPKTLLVLLAHWNPWLARSSCGSVDGPALQGQVSPPTCQWKICLEPQPHQMWDICECDAHRLG